METWDVDQNLLPFPNDSNWTLQQKSWRVYVEQMPRKCLNRPKTLILALSWCCFDQGETMISGPDMKFDLKQKLKFKWSATHFIVGPRPDSTYKCLI